MPLQNRVLPNGEIAAASWRGSLMGNRGGRIHDPGTKSLSRRRWASRRWIICRTAFKGRKRTVMGQGYTELFFLDEASALACGHRPCFECQRERATQFAQTWEKCFGKISGSKADHIDFRLHRERVQAEPRLIQPDPHEYPDGTFFQQGERFYAVRQGELLEWSGTGYTKGSVLPDECRLLTPPSILKVLRRGYMPVWHSSCRKTEV